MPPMPPPPPPAPAPSAAIPGGKGPSAFAGDPDYLGPISATPQKMVEEMLALAGVTEADAVYDLGCNDGRVCITAAKTRGARGVGVEIDPDAVAKARAKALEAGVSSLVDIHLGNAAKTDVAPATVVFAYLLPKGNAKLSRKLMRDMTPGARVATYIFRLPKDRWDEHMQTSRAFGSTRERGEGKGVDASSFNKIFIYRIPSEKPAWCREEDPARGEDKEEEEEEEGKATR